ncbi:hypothetical protein IFM47457_06973 [Aspergillus lentulus]|nr:hypothetical protein IFM47457_06973 [Aspergillus lentulus]
MATLTDYTKIDGSTNTTSPTASPTSNTSGSANSHGSSSHEVAVGVGVGVPLGVIAAIFLVWALWERRSRLGIIGNSSYAGAQSTYALANLSGGSSQKLNTPNIRF